MSLADLTGQLTGVDDTALFQNALNSYDEVTWDGHAYVGKLLLDRRCRLISEGYLHFLPGFAGTPTDPEACITITGPASAEGFTMIGSDAPTNYRDVPFDPNQNNRTAIQVNGHNARRLSDLEIIGFSAAAIRIGGNGANDFAPHATFRNFKIEYCWWGAVIDAPAEYVGLSGFRVGQCNRAFDTYAGNIKHEGHITQDNCVAMRIDGSQSTNPGHGVVTGCLLNHNTECSLKITGVLIGQIITGNQMQLGDIQLINSSDVLIANNQISAASWYFQGGGRNVVRSNAILQNVEDGLINTPNHNWNGISDNTICCDNFDVNGCLTPTKGLLVTDVSW